MLILYHLNNPSNLSSLLITVSTGQRDDDISIDSRQRRHSVEESHSPKANGTAIRLTSVSSSPFESNFPKLMSEVNQELLTSGAVILPGKGQASLSVNLLLSSLKLYISLEQYH